MANTKKPPVLTRTKREGKPMPAVLRNVPAGYDWGWYSREEPRMHLQVVDKKHAYLHYKVWLEDKAKRVFEPVGDVPPKILKKLRDEIRLKRASIEMEWVDLMIGKGWLRHRLADLTLILTAYPGTASQFERRVDLAPHLSPEEQARFKPADVGLNQEFAVIELWPARHESRRPFILIPPILWQD
jgi:hypothetical protein